MSKELTFVLTDVESSTTLWERFPDQMSPGIARHVEIIADAVVAQGGRLHRDRGEGDSTFSVFDSAAAAVAAAAAIGRALASEPWAHEAPIRVRVAVYTGEVEQRDGDYFGTSLNRAARVRSLAFGGQILLGDLTKKRLGARCPPGSALVDLGPRELKDLSEPEHVYELRLDDAGGPPEPLTDEGCSNVLWLDRVTSADFVGRETELRILDRAWDTTVNGQRVLALVGGEPGVGKTALVAQAARAIHKAGGLVLCGGWDEEVLAPYQAFREALSTYAQSCPRSILRADLRDHGSNLARLFPDVGSRIEASPAPAGTAADAERLRLFEAVEAWLDAITRRRPVLLVLEDAHWIDRSSVLLLQHLVRGARPSSLLILATYRDTDVEQSDLGRALPLLLRERGTQRVALKGLDVPDVRELLVHAPGSSVRSAETIAEDLHAETGGNPFFLQEMVRHLSDSGGLDAGGGAKIDVPESVRDIVRWRISRLSNELSEGLSVAAVMGQSFDFDVLTAATDIEEDRLLDALDEACRAGLAHEDAADRYVFSHAVVRRTLLDDLSAARRLRLHRRVAESLEQGRTASSLAELAYHFCAAAGLGLAAKAIAYARAAGDEAVQELAYEAAVRHYQRALDVQEAEIPADAELRCEILLELGDAHNKAGEYTQRDACFVQAAQFARELDRFDLFARAAVGYGGVLAAAVDPDLVGHALLEEALERIGERDSRDRGLVLARLAHWIHFTAPRSKRLALADEAVSIARRLGDRLDLAAALSHRCWALDGPDDMHDQLRLAAEIVELGDQLDNTEVRIEGVRLRADALFEAGEYEALRASAAEMAKLAKDVRHPEYMRLARSWDSVFASIEGRYDDAVLVADEVHELLRVMGHPQSEVVYIALSFPATWMRGSLGEAVPLFEALTESEPWRKVWPAVAAWGAAEGGMLDHARRILDAIPQQRIEALDKNYTWWPTIVGLTVAATTLGDAGWARLLYGLVLPYADRICAVGSTLCVGSASQHLGSLAATLHRWEAAEEHFETALATYERMRARPFTALTQQSYAQMLLDRGDPNDRDRASAMDEAALRTAAELGLKAVEHRAAMRTTR
jgi:class 3 adenylate cyclase/tetratricopeptide (TPR) repeat protein